MACKHLINVKNVLQCPQCLARDSCKAHSLQE